MEALISSMMAPGPDVNRPPHILLLITAPSGPSLMTESRSAAAKKRLAMVLAGGIAGVVVGLAGAYRVLVLRSKAAGDPAKDVACRPAVELAKKIEPFARGEVAAVNVAKSPLRVPD